MFKFLTHPFKSLGSIIAQSSNSIAFIIIGITTILGPILFVPFGSLGIQTGKGFLLGLLAIIGLLVIGITILKQGIFSVPRNPIFLILLGISCAAALGALFSAKFSMAFLGYGFESTTWFFVTAFGLFVFLAYQAVRDYDRIILIYGGLFSAFFVLGIIHTLRFLIGPQFLNLGVLNTSTSTLIGAWSDLGIFAGVILLLSVLTLQLVGLVRFVKWFVAGVGILAGIFLMVFGMKIIWVIIGFVSLLLTLYLFAFAYWDSHSHTYKHDHRVPWYVLLLFIVSLIGIFFGGAFNIFANRHQNIAYNDLRPSVGMTLEVAKKSLSHNFITGYGPNSFSQVWALSKPLSLSGTPFSGTDFSGGSSYVTSQVATNGLLGAILWISFFVLVGYSVLKRLSLGFERGFDRFMALSLGTIIIFLSIMSFVMIPGNYLLILLAVGIGTFLGTFLPIHVKTISFIKDPRASFFGILSITIIILGTLLGGYIVGRKLISFISDTRGLSVIAKGDVQGGLVNINNAAAYASHDVYHAQLAQLALNDATRITSSQGDKKNLAQQAEQVLGIALGQAKLAVDKNPASYKNWQLLGDIYNTAVLFGVKDAFTPATDAYTNAKQRNPNDATMELNFANLALANNDTVGALKFIQNSLDRYPTRDAYLLRAQIQIGQKKWGDVVASLRQAILLDSSNARLYVYLGVAYEKSGDMKNAEQVYNLIRNQFMDGADVINQVRKVFTQDEVIVQPANDSSSSVPVVAPSVKR